MTTPVRTNRVLVASRSLGNRLVFTSLTTASCLSCAAMLPVPATTSASQPPLAFRATVSRTHHAACDSIRVVTTATNTSRRKLSTWGCFEYTGGFRLSPESSRLYKAKCDSAMAALRGAPPIRDVCEHLETIIFVPRTWIEPHPFERIRLRPGESHADSVMFTAYPGQFDRYPGFLHVMASFILGLGPDTTGAVRPSAPQLEVSVPLP